MKFTKENLKESLKKYVLSNKLEQDITETVTRQIERDDSAIKKRGMYRFILFDIHYSDTKIIIELMADLGLKIHASWRQEETTQSFMFTNY